MKDRFLKVTLDGHFFDKHKKVLVAVSGGLDSMNLFHLLYECKQVLGIELGIAHINHGQREESVIEEKYLRQLAEESNVPFYLSYFEGVFFRRSGAKMALWIFCYNHGEGRLHCTSDSPPCR